MTGLLFVPITNKRARRDRARVYFQRDRAAFVLIDAAPLGIGHPVTGAANAP
jgi:hypothetical protein